MYKSINDFKKGYQLRTSTVQDEKGWLHIPIVLNVHGVNDDVRRAEIHAAEPLVPEPIAFEVEMAIQKPYF